MARTSTECCSVCYHSRSPGSLIQSNKNINRITINNTEQNILQYADKTQIIVTNDKSINEVFQQLRLFKGATGAKVNVQKTEGLFMGKWKSRHNKPFDCKQMIKYQFLKYINYR